VFEVRQWGSAVTFALVVSACGRIAFDPLSSDAARPDACTSFGAFSKPTVIAELDDVLANWSPWIGSDEREIYFGSYRAGNLGTIDLWRSVRSAPSEPFSAPANLVNLNSANDDRSPSLSDDRLTLYFTSDRPGGAGGYDVWSATRPDVDSAFGAPAPVAAFDTAAQEWGASPTADGLEMYVASLRTSSYDVYRSRRNAPTDLWPPLALVPQLSSPVDERGIALSRDGLEIFVCSLRPGGAGGFDVWVSTRPDVGSAWSMPVNVAELNTTNDELGVSLSSDGQVIYIAAGAAGNADIYQATRACSP